MLNEQAPTEILQKASKICPPEWLAGTLCRKIAYLILVGWRTLRIEEQSSQSSGKDL